MIRNGWIGSAERGESGDERGVQPGLTLMTLITLITLMTLMTLITLITLLILLILITLITLITGAMPRREAKTRTRWQVA
jgi:hypothetical protein